MEETCAAARLLPGDPPRWADRLSEAQRTIRSVTRDLQGEADPARRLANATVYLEAFGHIVVAWIWLQQAIAAAGLEGDFYAGKLQACRYFFDWELPKTGPQLALLVRNDTAALDMRDAWF